MPETLIAQALTAARAGREEARWEAVSELHRQADQPTLLAAQRLCAAPDPLERALGADVLGQLAYEEADAAQLAIRAQAADFLLAQLDREADPVVLSCICIALGHIHDPKAVSPVSSLRAHPHDEVRHAVAVSLAGHDDPVAIQALIELSADEDVEVRDWATFALGRQTEVDSVEIREALLARLEDEDADTAAEAVAGLAARGDLSALGAAFDLLEHAEPSDPSIVEQALEDLGGVLLFGRAGLSLP